MCICPPTPEGAAEGPSLASSSDPGASSQLHAPPWHGRQLRVDAKLGGYHLVKARRGDLPRMRRVSVQPTKGTTANNQHQEEVLPETNGNRWRIMVQQPPHGKGLAGHVQLPTHIIWHVK